MKDRFVLRKGGYTFMYDLMPNEEEVKISTVEGFKTRHTEQVSIEQARIHWESKMDLGFKEVTE